MQENVNCGNRKMKLIKNFDLVFLSEKCFQKFFSKSPSPSGKRDNSQLKLLRVSYRKYDTKEDYRCKFNALLYRYNIYNALELIQYDMMVQISLNPVRICIYHWKIIKFDPLSLCSSWNSYINECRLTEV